MSSHEKVDVGTRHNGPPKRPPVGLRPPPQPTPSHKAFPSKLQLVIGSIRCIMYDVLTESARMGVNVGIGAKWLDQAGLGWLHRVSSCFEGATPRWQTDEKGEIKRPSSSCCSPSFWSET